MFLKNRPDFALKFRESRVVFFGGGAESIGQIAEQMETEISKKEQDFDNQKLPEASQKLQEITGKNLNEWKQEKKEIIFWSQSERADFANQLSQIVVDAEKNDAKQIAELIAKQIDEEKSEWKEGGKSDTEIRTEVDEQVEDYEGLDWGNLKYRNDVRKEIMTGYNFARDGLTRDQLGRLNLFFKEKIQEAEDNSAKWTREDQKGRLDLNSKTPRMIHQVDDENQVSEYEAKELSRMLIEFAESIKQKENKEEAEQPGAEGENQKPKTNLESLKEELKTKTKTPDWFEKNKDITIDAIPSAIDAELKSEDSVELIAEIKNYFGVDIHEHKEFLIPILTAKFVKEGGNNDGWKNPLDNSQAKGKTNDFFQGTIGRNAKVALQWVKGFEGQEKDIAQKFFEIKGIRNNPEKITQYIAFGEVEKDIKNFSEVLRQEESLVSNKKIEDISKNVDQEIAKNREESASVSDALEKLKSGDVIAGIMGLIGAITAGLKSLWSGTKSETKSFFKMLAPDLYSKAEEMTKEEEKKEEKSDKSEEQEKQDEEADTAAETAKQKDKAGKRLSEFEIDDENIANISNMTAQEVLDMDGSHSNREAIDTAQLKRAIKDENLIDKTKYDTPMWKLISELSDEKWEKFKKYT